MNKFLESVRKRDFDRRISEVVEMLEEEQLYGTISLIKDLKYYLDLATKEKAHTCNCQHNSNSRDSEPCCRCDSRQTNADRIRNMSDEELAETIHSISCNATEISTCNEECLKCEQPDSYCVRNIMEWLQSEAEQERK